MRANEVIDAYVADVAVRLPRARRDDVAFELRALLLEALQDDADAAGRPADEAMALARVRASGRPADVAARYRTPVTIIDPADQVSAVAAVKVDHQTTIPVSARRGPKRSPTQPPGIWNKAYPIWKALKIQPIVTSEKPNSCWIDGAAVEITTRSI